MGAERKFKVVYSPCFTEQIAKESSEKPRLFWQKATGLRLKAELQNGSYVILPRGKERLVVR